MLVWSKFRQFSLDHAGDSQTMGVRVRFLFSSVYNKTQSLLLTSEQQTVIPLIFVEWMVIFPVLAAKIISIDIRLSRTKAEKNTHESKTNCIFSNKRFFPQQRV